MGDCLRIPERRCSWITLTLGRHQQIMGCRRLTPLHCSPSKYEQYGPSHAHADSLLPLIAPVELPGMICPLFPLRPPTPTAHTSPRPLPVQGREWSGVGGGAGWRESFQEDPDDGEDVSWIILEDTPVRTNGGSSVETWENQNLVAAGSVRRRRRPRFYPSATCGTTKELCDE